ncbi:baseplate protein [Dickeya dadantii]|uniref:baseplate assembly protein n=1 Tax=Dickeya dadantii TaxID=204038 RepID=UPI001495E47F|nr:baseplate J/gp47 family protein [Dickeya dadantii]NPE59295.1 baseplate protein [Dickeya dadantii]
MAVTTEPVFIDRDADAITAEMIAKYEADSGKTLYPAQAERLLLDIIAYREMLLRSAIQNAAKQNLVRYADAPMIDYLGELVGTYRLSAIAAIIKQLLFTVETVLLTDVLIPAGTRVSASDSVIFATDTDAVLKAGQTSVIVSATCTEAGTIGNGWQPAQVSTLLDEVDDVDFTVKNMTASSGGSDDESNDHLRERIMLAPEAFSTAGSRLAYRYHAMSAHPDIVDVAVVSPVPGTVALYPLMSGGTPSDAVLSLVESICSDEKVRPLTDTVTVYAPVTVNYEIRASLVIRRGELADTVKTAAESAVTAWVETKGATLGNDIVLSQLIAALSVTGVYDVAVSSPVASLTVAEYEWANCTNIMITVSGVSDD